MVCPACSFDSSRDYGKNPTFGPVGTVPSVSALRQDWAQKHPKPAVEPIILPPAPEPPRKKPRFSIPTWVIGSVPKNKTKTNHTAGTNCIAILLALTYFSSLPAGVIVTIASFFKFYSIDPNVINRVKQVLCIIGTIIGIAIYVYALANYSHAAEAMYTSIIGLITKLIIGDL